MPVRSRFPLLAAPVVAVATVLLLMSVATVPAGHVGVVTAFGRVDADRTLPEGLHLVAPWARVHPMSVRTQELKEEMDVPTQQGVTVHLEVSLLYALEPDRAAEVYQKAGPNFADVVLVPQFRSATRGTTVGFEAKDLYTAKRQDVEVKLEAEVQTLMTGRGVRCERVLMRRMDLPPAVRESIDRKVVAEQKAEQMEYELRTAKKEAERKQIEAEATAKAQETIKKSLDDHYIRYLWVKALETAATNRSATIYVPTGHDGLPLVGAVRSGSQAAAAPAGGQ